MAPAATVMVWLVLPAYIPSLPALFVLLPGVVAFSVTFVAGGYLTGIDRVGITSVVSVVSVVTNVIANLILIPPFVIVGAAHDHHGTPDDDAVASILAAGAR